MEPLASLSLAALGNIAQIVIAGASVSALFGAVTQIAVTRANARRARAYDYADRFNQPEIISLTARYTDYWDKHSFEDFSALSRQTRSKLLVIPNLIEEVAAAYNRNLIDRNVAAQMLGLLAEAMWERSRPLVEGTRKERDKWIYAEWEEMQKDTLQRRMAARRKTERRIARRRLLRRV
jgi:hypothetical protein